MDQEQEMQAALRGDEPLPPASTVQPGDSPEVAQGMAIMDAAYEGETTPVVLGEEEREAVARDALARTLQALYPETPAEHLEKAAAEVLSTAALRAFAMTHQQQVRVFVASIAHEVNRALCLGLGDTSQPTWAEATPEQQENMVRAVTLYMEYPSTTPTDAHIAWRARKEAEGWTWGAVRSPDAKRHPRLRPWHDLSEIEQAKYHVCRAVALSLGPKV